MAQRKLRILLRCMPGHDHRVCQQAFSYLSKASSANFRASSDFVASGMCQRALGTAPRAGFRTELIAFSR